MRKLLLTSTFIFVVLISYAQVGVEVGLKGGVNLANISTDADASWDSRTGFHAGAYGLVKLVSIGIQPEILYSQQGSNFSLSTARDDFSQDFTYLTFPIMLKFYLPLGLNLQGGPQFGMLMSAKGETINADGEVIDLDKDHLKNSDVSAALGVGWDTPFGLNLSLRYVLGLNDISLQTFDAKNRIFQVSAGFKLFKLGK